MFPRSSHIYCAFRNEYKLKESNLLNPWPPSPTPPSPITLTWPRKIMLNAMTFCLNHFNVAIRLSVILAIKVCYKNDLCKLITSTAFSPTPFH